MPEFPHYPVFAVAQDHLHPDTGLHLVSTDEWYPCLAAAEIFGLVDTNVSSKGPFIPFSFHVGKGVFEDVLYSLYHGFAVQIGLVLHFTFFDFISGKLYSRIDPDPIDIVAIHHARIIRNIAFT